ncbi:hypothetical protein DSO57_1002112 [Entomophthora muscae]|uniref:Uncharacterized protein n=2 Tax=Entomophthora muscae TaxID=34485 RepID=A0ACC2TUJ7_9FUNG|nr:hypothetical protein DSO57_1006841 [Entomophthora muscae]KAJ9078875.1 hypothetical protein DSO57_1002112 [Entomophthora muscae]
MSKKQTDSKSQRRIVGVVPVDFKSNRILLVSSRKHPNQWVLPKGGVEAGETDEMAAIRECQEEAGVTGTIEGSLGQFSAVKPGKKNQNQFDKPGDKISERSFTFFILHITDYFPDEKWLEREERKRQWFTFVEAAQAVRYEGMREAIVSLEQMQLGS